MSDRNLDNDYYNSPAPGQNRTPDGRETNPLLANNTDVTFDRRAYGGRGYDDLNGRAVMGTSGADRARQRYIGLGEAAAQRAAYQQDYGGFNAYMGAGEGSRQSQYDALATQRDAASLQQQAAMGQAPSQAAILGQQMVDRSLDAQLAGAASARGGSLAQAAAMRNARQGAVQFQQQGAQQIAAMRAQEMAEARNGYMQGAAGYMQGASGIRSGDYDAAKMALAQTQLQTQNDQFQRQLNQQGQMGYEGMAQGVDTAQLQAGLQSSAQDEGHWEAQGQFDQANSDRTLKYVGAGMSAGGGVLGALLAKGGPAKGGKPYLVGEYGPELVVPNRDGYVMTAQQTAALLGAPPTNAQRAYLGQIAGARAQGGPISGDANPYGASDASEYNVMARQRQHEDANPYGASDPSEYDLVARQRHRQATGDARDHKVMGGAASGIGNAGALLSASTQPRQPLWHMQPRADGGPVKGGGLAQAAAMRRGCR